MVRKIAMKSYNGLISIGSPEVISSSEEPSITYGEPEIFIYNYVYKYKIANYIYIFFLYNHLIYPNYRIFFNINNISKP